MSACWRNGIFRGVRASAPLRDPRGCSRAGRLCLGGVVIRQVEADYLVVGAGASGMAFTDALIDHADARVALVDRRHGVGGHWLEAYPFVRLHQSSTFYGVASTVLGGGRIQETGPEAGLHERAGQSTICAYYENVLADRMVASGRVELFAGCEYLGDRTFVSRVSGKRYAVPERCRVVDARYLAPDIPAETPPKFGVVDGARVIPVNDLVHAGDAPEPVRRRGVGQDRDGCLHLAAGPRGRPRRDLLGAAARPVDAQPGADPARPRHLPRHGRRHDARGNGGGIDAGPVPPAGGRRHHAAHRPRGHADHGQGAHPRDLGARAAAQHRATSSVAATSSRSGADGSTSRTGRSPSPTTPWS